MARCPRLVGHTALEKAVAVGPGGAAVGDARVAGLAALPAEGQFRSQIKWRTMGSVVGLHVAESVAASWLRQGCHAASGRVSAYLSGSQEARLGGSWKHCFSQGWHFSPGPQSACGSPAARGECRAPGMEAAFSTALM